VLWGPSPFSVRRVRSLVRGLPPDAMTRLVMESAPPKTKGKATSTKPVPKPATAAEIRRFFGRAAVYVPKEPK